MLKSYVALGIVAVALVGRISFAQQEHGDSPQMQMPKPGKEHAILKRTLGTWDATVRSWMDPSQPAMESKGTEVCESIAGGMWVESKFKGDFMGTPFEGQGMTGYDTRTKKYIGTWVDSMSSGLILSEGSYDAKDETLVLTAKFASPMTGEPVVQRQTMKFVGKNKRTFVAENKQADGKWRKSMEITYTRANAN